MKRFAPTLLRVALALALAAPASAHLLQRGTPLSELAASSPVAVIGRVLAVESGSVELHVEQSVLGSAKTGSLRFALGGHHPPRYETGTRVLVFLASDAPPWLSLQSTLDKVEVPSNAAERESLLGAVHAFAALRALPNAEQRIATLKTLSLEHLRAANTRVRHEALLDLIAIAPRVRFDATEIAHLGAIAGSGDTPPTLAPGLVVLLTMIRQPEAERALHAVLESQGDPQARARAARVIGKRNGAGAVEALRRVLKDPAPAVRATAERALSEIDSKTASKRIALDSTPSIPREGKHDAVPKADPN